VIRSRPPRRGLALFAALLIVYAATLALPGRRGDDRSARETRILLVAVSLERDGDLTVANQYRDGTAERFHAGPLRPAGPPHLGRQLEPVDLGLPIVAAPLLSLDGVALVSLLCAAAMALAFALGAAIARRVVPDPWATGAALAVGVSPPVLAAAGALGPEPLGAALLAGATLCALRVREAEPHPPLRLALAAAVQLALLPWFSAELSLAGIVVAAALVHWMLRRGRGLQAIVAGEAVVFSAVAYVSVNERLFGGIVPQVAAAGPATGATGAGEHLERLDRVVTVWADFSSGLLAWAPVLVLALHALLLLWHSRRERLAVALPDVRGAEIAVSLCALACGAQLAVAVVLVRSLEGEWFPGTHVIGALPLAVPLCAWSLRRASRIGAALVALTLGVSSWLVIAVATGVSGLAPPSAPGWLGPACVAAALAGLAALCLRTARH
jgi:hypothetical protein